MEVVGVGAQAPRVPVPPGYVDVKVGEEDKDVPYCTLRVPLARLVLPPRAEMFLKRKGFVSWCKWDRDRDGLCMERFEGVEGHPCPYAHCATDELRQEIHTALRGLGVPLRRLPVEADCCDGTSEQTAHNSTSLTVVVTTSPVASNPSTQLFEALLSTFAVVPTLEDCPLVVMCDGYEVLGAESKKKTLGYKRGVVTQEAAHAYEEYKTRLRSLLATRPRTAVVALPSRHGFGWAVRTAIGKHVRTPFVMVIQHDRLFRCGFDLPGVLDVMARNPQYAVVYMKTPSMQDHDKKIQSRVHTPGGQEWGDEGEPIEVAPSIFFTRCFAWLDTTHIARVDHLKRFVFGSRGLPAGSGVPIKCGEFPEDKLNQVQIKALRDDGFSSHARFGTWILQSSTPTVSHISGRAFRVEGTSGTIVRRILDGQGDRDSGLFADSDTEEERPVTDDGREGDEGVERDEQSAQGSNASL
eukprot:Sspe_Gene.20228::Locus_7424_Transcript_1_1_Confidence_1.000_Length_1495::g.20228::m.20228